MPSTASTRGGTTLAIAARHERGQRAGEAAHAQRPAVVTELGDLRVGQRQALGQASAWASASAPGLGGVRPAGPAVQQPRAHSRSSAATCWDTAGWVSDSSRAAAENEPARATARKVEQAARILH